MQLASCAVLLACFQLAGQAFANPNRQISLNPSPPPPSSTATVPGALFSVVVPGYTNLTWSSTLSSTLCAGLKNRASGYPSANVECVVNAITTTAGATPGINAVAASGWMIWTAFPGMTATDQTTATNSRDLFLSATKASPNALNIVGLQFVNLNDTCDASWATDNGNTASDAAGQPIAGWNSQARCRMAPLGLTPEVAGDFNFATTTTSTIGAVGIDNGKQCPLGAPFIIPSKPMASAIAPLSATSNVMYCKAASSTQFDCYIGLATGGLPTAMASVANLGYSMAGQYITIEGTALTGATPAFATTGTNVWSNVQGNALATGQVVAGACDAAALANLRTAISSAAVRITGPAVPGVATATANKPTTFSVTVPSVGACVVGTDAIQYMGISAASVFGVTSALWSPDCDSNDAFYGANAAGSATPPAIGRVCPLCGTVVDLGEGGLKVTKQLFNFNGANAGKFCTTISGTNLVSGTPRTAAAAGAAGLSCIGSIGVANYGAGNPRTGRPMLAAAMPYPVSSVFPTPTFAAESVQAYDATAGVFKTVAIDSEFGVPCSTPQITKPPSTAGIALGIVSNRELGAAGSAIGYGTCNTQSRFSNGGTAANGISFNTYQSALLSATFTAAISAFPPPPSPYVVPAPAPKPAPAPTPAPAPVPPPATTCTYSGVYTIESVACSGKFIAYNNDPASNNACTNSTLMLRTDGQSQGPRRFWTINASAVSGTVPTAIGVIASGRTGKCPNDKYTNLAAVNSSPTPRLAGSGWKNRIIPVDASKGCDTVWIQAVGDNSYQGKYLGYGSCSSQTAFKWEAASSSSVLQWKLTKA